MFIAWTVFFFLRSSVGAQLLLPAGEGTGLGFAPNGARSLRVSRGYKHLARLERKRRHLLHFQLEFAKSQSGTATRRPSWIITRIS